MHRFSRSIFNRVVQTRRNAHSAINKKSIFLGGKTSHVSPVRYYAVKANDIPSVATYISQIITNAAKKAYPSMANSTLVTSFRVLSTKADGDYAAHIALPLAQELSLSPVEVAENILKNIEPSEVVGEITTNKGFLNVHLSDDWLAKNIVTKQIVDRKATREKKRLLIDYASPNMGKELHVGHLRSIMVGDCLQRIFTHQGHDVMKVSHVGDFGTPMGQVLASALHEKDPWFVKLMSQSEVKPANWQDIPESEWPSIHRLYQLYVAAKKNAGEEFVKNSTKFLHAIQKPNGDWRVKRGWEILCEVSRRAFNELYEKLGVSVEEYGESRYAPLLPKVFEMLQNKGLLTEVDGALTCDAAGKKNPLVVRKPDGSSLYPATDLAALYYRLMELKLDELYYVTDASQAQHFNAVFEVARQAGWATPKNRIEHVPFGVVQGAKGTKISSREGDSMTLKGLLEQAVEETKKAVHAAKSVFVRSHRTEQVTSHKYAPGVTDKFSEPERLNQADPSLEVEFSTNVEAIAYNAIKYFELSKERKSNYVFSFQEMLSFKGNTSMYLVYAYTRIRAIRRKAQEANIPIPELLDASDYTNTSEWKLRKEERALVMKLIQFPDVIRSIEDTLQPHFLSLHLFQTAQAFHHFYDHCRILGQPEQDQRLRLCVVTEQLMSNGLSLLNVEALDRV